MRRALPSLILSQKKSAMFIRPDRRRFLLGAAATAFTVGHTNPSDSSPRILTRSHRRPIEDRSRRADRTTRPLHRRSGRQSPTTSQPARHLRRSPPRSLHRQTFRIKGSPHHGDLPSHPNRRRHRRPLRPDRKSRRHRRATTSFAPSSSARMRSPAKLSGTRCIAPTATRATASS